MPTSPRAALTAIEYYLPERVVTNEELAAEFQDWTADKIESKTGIRERRIAASGECSSDLAEKAARRLFQSGACKPEEIDYLLLCTQSPDYFLPTTACVLQNRLGLPTKCGALDINLGCSGFVYALGVAKGLIQTGQAKAVLLITADTYSKFIHEKDKSVRTLFGDAAAAALVSSVEAEDDFVGHFVYGTDGRGAENLIVPTGGCRKGLSLDAALTVDASGNARTENNLYMNGPEIFNFTQKVVPAIIRQTLERAGLQSEDIDLFALHQANRYVLDFLRKKMGVAEEKWPILMRDCGNTVSSSIPILLAELCRQGRLKSGTRVLLAGFGVGYSWAGVVLRWHAGATQASPA